MSPPLHTDPSLRSTLLDYFVENATGVELTDWLRGLGQDLRGSVAEKKERILQHTKYLSMSPDGFPAQTMNYLAGYSSDHLGGVCEALSLSQDGTKDARYRRIMREVRCREGWLLRPAGRAVQSWTASEVLPFIEYYPIVRRGKYEADFYAEFADEMAAVFGPDSIHEQLAIAYGNPLKIDFHLGHPQQEGIGVEFKMPTSNAEIQRALGQLDQYIARYANGRLIIVVLPDFLTSVSETLFLDAVRGKGVHVVVK